MADLEFKKNVPQIPAGPEIPEYKRSVTAEVSPTPDYQDAVNKYAADTNWESSLGSAVATRASNQLATTLGAEAGKTPHGELGPDITEADKVFRESYNSQAHATLGLQADKLITDTSIYLAKQPKITPDLIANTQNEVSTGLNNIFQNAPSTVRPLLEKQYKALQMTQNVTLVERMVREQNKEEKATLINSVKQSSQNAYALSASGQYDKTEDILKSVKKDGDNAEAKGTIFKGDSDKLVTSVRQSSISGRLQYEYDKARLNHKEDEYINGLSVNKPDWIPANDYTAVMKNFIGYVQNQSMLRNAHENVEMTQFQTKVIQDPTNITDGDLLQLRDSVNDERYNRGLYFLQKQLNIANKKHQSLAIALASYSDPNKFFNLSAEDKNAAFEHNWKAMQQQPKNIASKMTDDEAKVIAAAVAPGPIPSYINELNGKGHSADPAQLEVVGQALNYFNMHNMNQNLIGIDKETQAMVNSYTKKRNYINPVDNAQQSHDAVFNKSEEQKKANDEGLVKYWKKNAPALEQAIAESAHKTLGLISTGLTAVGIRPSIVMRNFPGYRKQYEENFNDFYRTSNGDEEFSKNNTQDLMNSQYGISHVSNENEFVFQPIENVPGMPPNSQGGIQTDILEQANEKFVPDKKFYDKGKVDFWYEARMEVNEDKLNSAINRVNEIKKELFKEHKVNFSSALQALEIDPHLRNVGQGQPDLINELNHNINIIHKFNNQPIIIAKHNRSGKDEFFEATIEANPWGVKTNNPNQPVSGGWDIKLKTPNGTQAIALKNPVNSILTYNPKIDRIQKLVLNPNIENILTYTARERNIPEKSFYNLYPRPG